jgi:hypothetical protein
VGGFPGKGDCCIQAWVPRRRQMAAPAKAKSAFDRCSESTERVAS